MQSEVIGSRAGTFPALGSFYVKDKSLNHVKFYLKEDPRTRDERNQKRTNKNGGYQRLNF